jgi:broad specificity phosphatase PhoE
VAGVVCSELSRAVQTAELAAAVLGLPVTVRTGLQEFDVGDERGREYDPEVFDPVMAAWRSGELARKVSGGGTGAGAADRVRAVGEGGGVCFRGETVLAVTHGGVILALWGRIDPASAAAPTADSVANGSSYVFERDADGWRPAR